MVANKIIRIDPEAEISIRHTADTYGNRTYVLEFFPGLMIGLTKEQLGKIIDETWPHRTTSSLPDYDSDTPLTDQSFEEIGRRAKAEKVCVHLLLNLLSEYDTCGWCVQSCCRPCFAIHQSYCGEGVDTKSSFP